jgi:hypothetical protein
MLQQLSKLQSQERTLSNTNPVVYSNVRIDSKEAI